MVAIVMSPRDIRSAKDAWWRICSRRNLNQSTFLKEMKQFENLGTFTKSPLGDLNKLEQSWRKLLNSQNACLEKEKSRWQVSKQMTSEVSLQVFKNYVNVASKWVPFSKWFHLNKSISSLNGVLFVRLWRAAHKQNFQSLHLLSQLHWKIWFYFWFCKPHTGSHAGHV